MKINRLAITASIAVLMMGAAHAQDADGAGELEYLYGCAGCHGMFGEGDGPVGPMLNTQAPDLTTISLRNGGAFPYLDVIKTVDGRGDNTHPGIMPVWGKELQKEFGDSFGPYGAEIMIRGRIMSLAYYIESIQQK